MIRSEVYDRNTSQPINSPYISLYSLPDTLLLEEGILADYLNGETVPKSTIELGIKDVSKQYLVKIEKEGYNTGWIKFDASTAGKNELTMSLDPIFLKPRQ